MKIYFDNIVFTLQKSGGISVVWSELIKRIVNENRFESHFIEYENNTSNIFRKTLNLPKNQIIRKNKLCVKLSRYFNIRLSKEKKPYIFHSSYYRTSSNKNAINVTTVHDFIYEKFRSGIAREIHCYQKKLAILNSDIIICVSENTKKDLLEIYPNIAPEKVFVVYNGVSDEYFINKSSSEFQLPFDAQKYMIFVGIRDEYKRFDMAVLLAEKLNLNLVIVGGGKLSKKEQIYIKSKLTEKQFKKLENLSNSQLNILYSNALCLIYPSTYEGFGIPVIEAQKAGCPVVAYNQGAVKEIIGNSSLLFDKFDVSEIAKKITNNLYETEKRDEIIENGLVNSKRFSWDITYKNTLNIYDLIIKRKIN